MKLSYEAMTLGIGAGWIWGCQWGRVGRGSWPWAEVRSECQVRLLNAIHCYALSAIHNAIFFNPMCIISNPPKIHPICESKASLSNAHNRGRMLCRLLECMEVLCNPECGHCGHCGTWVVALWHCKWGWWLSVASVTNLKSSISLPSSPLPSSIITSIYTVTSPSLHFHSDIFPSISSVQHISQTA